MSDASKRFGAAARLYAENAAVVDEMWRAFLDDLAKFVDALREQIQAKLVNCELDEEASKAARCWWIKDDGVNDKDEVSNIWFRTQEPEIIMPGELRVSVYSDVVDEPVRKLLAAIPSKLKLPAHCRLENKPGLFTLIIGYGDDDPVTLAADPMRDLLLALREADKARSKSPA